MSPDVADVAEVRSYGDFSRIVAATRSAATPTPYCGAPRRPPAGHAFVPPSALAGRNERRQQPSLPTGVHSLCLTGRRLEHGCLPAAFSLNDADAHRPLLRWPFDRRHHAPTAVAAAAIPRPHRCRILSPCPPSPSLPSSSSSPPSSLPSPPASAVSVPTPPPLLSPSPPPPLPPPSRSHVPPQMAGGVTASVVAFHDCVVAVAPPPTVVVAWQIASTIAAATTADAASTDARLPWIACWRCHPCRSRPRPRP